MPSQQAILDGLTVITNDWRALAIAWHIVVGAGLVAFISGWRPRKQFAGVLLAMPLAAVSILAWVSGNPFNGLVFAIFTVVLVGIAIRLPAGFVSVGNTASVVRGVMLLAFGWAYPHFVQSGSWATYLYAAPLGLIPCPTLSAVIGAGLTMNGLQSRAWSMTLAVLGLFYGLFGVIRLGVTMDLILLAGAILLAEVARRGFAGVPDRV